MLRMALRYTRYALTSLMTVDLPRGASASTMAEPVAAVTVVHDVVTPLGCLDPVFIDSITGSGKNDRPPFSTENDDVVIPRPSCLAQLWRNFE